MNEKQNTLTDAPVRAGSLPPETMVFTYNQASALFDEAIQIGRQAMLNDQLEALKTKAMEFLSGFSKTRTICDNPEPIEGNRAA